jgi:TRAP-type C4-dicarboxylate transport system substrate-binding protein
MKKIHRALIVAILIVANVTFWSGYACAVPVELSLSLLIPPKHMRYTQVLEPWSKMVEEKTGGNVKITPYFSSALNSFSESFDAAVNGIADISEGITRDVPGRFPVTETLGSLGIGLGTSQNYTRAFWYLYKTVPEVQAEFKGVKVLWVYSSPPAFLVTRKAPVRSLADLKGLKIRTVGASPAETGKALGFTPVSISMGELYMSLEKGVVDGAIVPADTLVARRLGEVIKYVTQIDLGATLFFVVMNEDSFNRLPEASRKVIDELSGEWAIEFASKKWDKFDEQVKIEMTQKGVEYLTLPDSEVALWKERMQPLSEAYAQVLESKKLPGRKVLAEIQKFQPK